MADDALAISFYPVDSDQPIRVLARSWFDGWTSLSQALADHFGAAAAECFQTDEAYWNRDSEYAELVTLDGRIVGAVNRPISIKDVAEIRGIRSMQKRAFINRIRSLSNIDGHALPELGSRQQSEFLRDPVRYFLSADEAQSDAIMREVESRQKDELSHPRREFASANSAAPQSRPETVKAPKAKKPKNKVDGQRELLLPIAGGKFEEQKSAKVSAPKRRAG